MAKQKMTTTEKLEEIRRLQEELRKEAVEQEDSVDEAMETVSEVMELDDKMVLDALNKTLKDFGYSTKYVGIPSEQAREAIEELFVENKGKTITFDADVVGGLMKSLKLKRQDVVATLKKHFQVDKEKGQRGRVNPWKPK